MITRSFLPILASIALVAAAQSACAQSGGVALNASEAHPLMAGAKAPDAVLTTVDSTPVRLSRVLAHKPTILVFYRGSWCPFCNAHLAALGMLEEKIRAKGFQIVAVSPDIPSDLKKMADKHHLSFTLLSDSRAEALKKFGVAFRVDDETFSKYKNSYGIDLEKASGQTHHILPVPSVFIINSSGRITFAHSNPDYKVRMSGDEILKALDQ